MVGSQGAGESYSACRTASTHLQGPYHAYKAGVACALFCAPCTVGQSQVGLWQDMGGANPSKVLGCNQQELRRVKGWAATSKVFGKQRANPLLARAAASKRAVSSECSAGTTSVKPTSETAQRASEGSISTTHAAPARPPFSHPTVPHTLLLCALMHTCSSLAPLRPCATCPSALCSLCPAAPAHPLPGGTSPPGHASR